MVVERRSSRSHLINREPVRGRGQQSGALGAGGGRVIGRAGCAPLVEVCGAALEGDGPQAARPAPYGSSLNNASPCHMRLWDMLLVGIVLVGTVMGLSR